MANARVSVFNQEGTALFDITSDKALSIIRTEELNRENSLSITTTEQLTKEQRVIVKGYDGIFREYVVVGVDEEHGQHASTVGTYQCEWSLQHDFTQLAIEDKRPGLSGTKVSAAVALQSLIDGTGTNRWQVGTVDVETLSGASFYHESAWDALSKIVEQWGGEVVSEIEVDSHWNVTRKISLLAHRGSSEAVRRFDYGYDIRSIRRTVSEDPIYCRVIPLGKGEDTNGDGSGYGRRINISSVNNGRNYLKNDSAEIAFRLSDGQGGYDYPTVYITEDSIETPSDLLAWGLSQLDNYTTPKVTYESDVATFVDAGMDANGLALGDEIQCNDSSFHPDAALKISGRVLKIVVDELYPAGATITLGRFREGFGSLLSGYVSELKSVVAGAQSSLSNTVESSITSHDHLQWIISNINKELNLSGGYTYLKPGQGVVSYNKAEDSNPTNAIRIKDGKISAASSKTQSAGWLWKTMPNGYVSFCYDGNGSIAELRFINGLLVSVSPSNAFTAE